jgi:outer membrane protein TolC
VPSSRRAFFPRIRLTASGGTRSDQHKDLANGDFSVWSIASGITQPLFQGGRLHANLRQSHAAADQALAAYALALLRAFGEVESALVAERSLKQQEDHIAEAAAQSEAARDLAERQYNAGVVDYITVLETQRRSLAARSELLVVRRQRIDARINLHLALGGGFNLEAGWTTFLVDSKDRP